MGFAKRSFSPINMRYEQSSSDSERTERDGEGEESDVPISRLCAGMEEEHQDENKTEELLVLPGQLDIRSWLVPSAKAQFIDLNEEMPQAAELPDSADEEAAKHMGLSLDLAEPEDPHKELLLAAEAENLRAKVLEELAHAEEVEELEEEARQEEARRNILAQIVDDQEQVEAARSLGLGLGLSES